jgi:hypothetical protein
MSSTILRSMSNKAGRSRPGQKYFSLGTAREPFEAWCRDNAYDERAVMLAGWVALAGMTHDERVKLFRGLEALEKAGFDIQKIGGEKPATAAVQTRPAEKTPSQGSRRAG